VKERSEKRNNNRNSEGIQKGTRQNLRRKEIMEDGKEGIK